MRKRELLLSLAAALILTTGSSAANWQALEHGNHAWFMDTDSIQKMDRNTKQVWLKIKNEKGLNEMVLVSVTRDGQVKELDTTEDRKLDNEKKHIVPDTPMEDVFHTLWSKKERSKMEKESPNRWEQKGENAADSAANRAINRVLNKIGWGWW